MANNRNIIEVDSEGISTLGYVGIFNMLVENIRAIYGEDIDISPESPQGNELRFLASLFDQFALAVVDMSSTFDLSAARGKHLDNLVYFSTGLERYTPTFSTLASINITLDSSITIYPEQLNQEWVINTIEGTRWISLGPVTSVAGGYQMSMRCDILGPQLIDDATLISSLYISGNYITDKVTINPLAIPLMQNVGTEEETDRQFLTRVTGAIGQGSKTLAASVKQLLLSSLPGSIKDVKVINSNGAANLFVDILTDDTIDGYGVKNVKIDIHDVLVVVQPKMGVTISESVNGLRIAELLQEQITPGIRTMPKLDYALENSDSYLTFTLPAGEDYGDLEETIRFKVATQYDPDITIRLKQIGTSLSGTAKAIIAETIKNKIQQLSRGYVINQEINITELRNQIEDGSQIKQYTIDDAHLSGGITIDGGSATDFGYWLISDPNDNITVVWSV